MVRLIRRSITMAFFLVLAPGAAVGQATAADTAAVLLEAASRFQTQGDRRIAEALLALIARDYAATPAGATAAERLAGLQGTARAESGRVELIVWGTLYGAWLGTGVPAMFGADDPAPYGAGLLIAAPVGFAAARAYVRSTSMSLGQARAIRWGSIWGTWQGIGWQEVFDIGDRTERLCDQFNNCYEYPVESERAPVTAAVLGGVTGLATGVAIARSSDISPGTATLVEFGSLWGTWYAGAATVLLDVDGEDAVLTWLLLGGNAGLLSGALAGPRLGWSAGRARLVSITGVAGLVVGLGFDLLLEVDDDKTAMAIPLATSVIGLALGTSWTRDYDATRRELGERAATALVNVRNGRLGVSVPIPAPTMLPLGFEGGRMRRAPGLSLRLLDASFSTGR
ncbi:MAG TPA: hypothetical protein VNL18_11880 [Gemmatimonadales bacterium]|nr:hypothetical protein [Gemmatimonadales bacterium]